MFFLITIFLTALVSALFLLLPGQLLRRSVIKQDIVWAVGLWLATWLFAVFAYHRPGLTVGFNAFRLVAVTALNGWAGFVTAGLHSFGRKGLKAIVPLLLVTALGLEVFVGNIAYFNTHSYEPFQLVDYLDENINIGRGLGTISLEEGRTYLRFLDIDHPIYNLRFDGLVSDDTDPLHADSAVTFTIEGTDAANTELTRFGSWQIGLQAPRTHTISLDLTGNVGMMTLTAAGYSSTYAQFPVALTFSGITANAPRALDFSVLRFIAVFLALLTLYSLRPASGLWHRRWLAGNVCDRAAAAVLGLVLAAFVVVVPFWEPSNTGLATKDYNTAFWDGKSTVSFVYQQYGALAHSLLNGRLDLQRDPPAAMAEMQNPYDTAARQSAAPDALWDVAYYQGRYYVYFGIVPCLLFQLPFELLTGVPDLPPSLAMIVMAWLLILAVFGLVWQAAQRWFPSASAAACLLAAAGIAGGSQVYYLLLRPSVYEYAILCGAAFVLLALWQWLCAANTPVQHHGKIMLHMALGSLCMALVAGCRPQMELFAVLCLPIFWPQYIRQKRLRSKQGITEAIAFVLPVILVALGLMAYNAARFGSPFDFGANYNLTSNDMTHRGFRIGRLAPALFTYFLSLPVVQAVFPYLAGTKMQTNFMGMTITEVFYGGALVSLPLLWAFAALPLLRRRMARQKDLRAMVLLPVLLAVILAALDGQMAGVLYRYLSDYLTPLLFAAALVWLWAESALAPRVQVAASGSILHTVQHMLQGAMLAAVAMGICYSFCVYFAAEPGLLGQNPALYQNVSRLVQFWL